MKFSSKSFSPFLLTIVRPSWASWWLFSSCEQSLQALFLAVKERIRHTFVQLIWKKHNLRLIEQQEQSLTFEQALLVNWRNEVKSFIVASFSWHSFLRESMSWSSERLSNCNKHLKQIVFICNNKQKNKIQHKYCFSIHTYMEFCSRSDTRTPIWQVRQTPLFLLSFNHQIRWSFILSNRSIKNIISM